MLLEPFSNEQVHDPQFEERVAHLCLHPEMYIGRPSFVAVCAYLDGFNHARKGGPLIGLQQWLIVRVNGGNNLHWAALARRGFQTGPVDAELTNEEQEIRSLGQFLAEFFEYRRAKGITKVFHDHARWLLRQSWYTGPLRS